MEGSLLSRFGDAKPQGCAYGPVKLAFPPPERASGYAVFTGKKKTKNALPAGDGFL